MTSTSTANAIVPVCFPFRRGLGRGETPAPDCNAPHRHKTAEIRRDRSFEELTRCCISYFRKNMTPANSAYTGAYVFLRAAKCLDFREPDICETHG